MSSKCFITFLNTTTQTERSGSNSRLQPPCLHASHSSFLRRKVASPATLGIASACACWPPEHHACAHNPPLSPRLTIARMIWSGTLDERICLMYRENKNPFCQENSEPLNSTSARRTWVEKDLYLPGNTLKAKVYPG